MRAKKTTRKRPLKNLVDGPNKQKRFFAIFAKKTADYAGKPLSFTVALTIILIWAVTGTMFDYSDTWQLIINTSTTIVTFLMVFLIQNAQNRDSRDVQIKLDELIRVTEGAHTALLDLEELPDQELYRMLCRYQEIAAESRRRLALGEEDTHIADVPDDK